MIRHLPSLLVGLVFASLSIAEQPLHVRIDQSVGVGKTAFDEQSAPLTTDSEFVRRVHLDLIGRIPTPNETRAYLADSAPEKRVGLIDKLLSSPEYAAHLANVFDVMLMERRPGNRVTQAEWLEYLRASFAANKPWDQLAYEILSADGANPKLRPAARFLLDRNVDLTIVTKDISRLFLGKNLQCAQCHDHPLVDEYVQDDYFGLQAFLNRTTLFIDATKKIAMLSEKADGEVSYQSVFDKNKTTKTTPPMLLGRMRVFEPRLPKGKEYLVASAANVRLEPMFSRRAQLAPLISSPLNASFSRNMANRLWAHMFGRGLVHPLDYDHTDNPPSHPELLNLLSQELVRTRFDVKAYLREIARSQTYQRSSSVPAGKQSAVDKLQVARIRPLSPEQLGLSLLEATGQKALEKSPETASGPVIAQFVGLAGEPDGFQASMDQALYLRNGSLVRSWIAPKPGNLADRLGKLKGDDELVEELILTLYSRVPEESERKTIREFLASPGMSRSELIQELIWACLAAVEFRFNF